MYLLLNELVLLKSNDFPETQPGSSSKSRHSWSSTIIPRNTLPCSLPKQNLSNPPSHQKYSRPFIQHHASMPRSNSPSTLASLSIFFNHISNTHSLLTMLAQRSPLPQANNKMLITKCRVYSNMPVFRTCYFRKSHPASIVKYSHQGWDSREASESMSCSYRAVYEC